MKGSQGSSSVRATEPALILFSYRDAIVLNGLTHLDVLAATCFRSPFAVRYEDRRTRAEDHRCLFLDLQQVLGQIFVQQREAVLVINSVSMDATEQAEILAGCVFDSFGTRQSQEKHAGTLICCEINARVYCSSLAQEVIMEKVVRQGSQRRRRNGVPAWLFCMTDATTNLLATDGAPEGRCNVDRALIRKRQVSALPRRGLFPFIRRRPGVVRPP